MGRVIAAAAYSNGMKVADIGVDEKSPLHPDLGQPVRKHREILTAWRQKKTLNLDNLAALGPERLAAILIDVAAGNAEIKRRLRLELAERTGGGDALAAEVGKRLTALRSARSFVDWQKRREFLKDLDQQRVMIVDRVAQTRRDLALDLMWRFMDLAEPVFNRVDDSNGSVGDVFHTACDNLAAIAVMARPDPASLADRVFTALSKNDYGLFDNLVQGIFPALGETGVDRLRTRLTEALTSPALWRE